MYKIYYYRVDKGGSTKNPNKNKMWLCIKAQPIPCSQPQKKIPVSILSLSFTF